jgi:STE24 endopeptidase
VEPVYSPAELAEVAAYQTPYYLSSAIDTVLWPVLLTLFALYFPGRWKPREGITFSLRFALTYFLSLALLYLPIDFWFDYVREHEFGLSSESAGSYLWDELKSWALYVGSISALTVGVFGLAKRTRHWWWLVALVSSVALIASIALDPYKVRLYVDQNPLPPGELRTQLTTLLERAEVPFADILVVNTSEKSVRVGAAFAGTGATRTILLTDTLLEKMTRAEIAVGVAHEAGHVREPRWPGRILSVLALFGLLGFWEWLFRIAAKRHWYGITSRGDVRVLPLLMLFFTMVLEVGAPISGAISRGRESEADAYAVQLTHDPASLISLLRKLTRINKSDPDPPRWFVLLGASHPSLTERVEAIQKNATPAPPTTANVGTSEQQEPGVMR